MEFQALTSDAVNRTATVILKRILASSEGMNDSILDHGDLQISQML